MGYLEDKAAEVQAKQKARAYDQAIARNKEQEVYNRARSDAEKEASLERHRQNLNDAGGQWPGLMDYLTNQKDVNSTLAGVDGTSQAMLDFMDYRNPLNGKSGVSQMDIDRGLAAMQMPQMGTTIPPQVMADIVMADKMANSQRRETPTDFNNVLDSF